MVAVPGKSGLSPVSRISDISDTIPAALQKPVKVVTDVVSQGYFIRRRRRYPGGFHIVEALLVSYKITQSIQYFLSYTQIT